MMDVSINLHITLHSTLNHTVRLHFSMKGSNNITITLRTKSYLSRETEHSISNQAILCWISHARHSFCPRQWLFIGFHQQKHNQIKASCISFISHIMLILVCVSFILFSLAHIHSINSNFNLLFIGNSVYVGVHAISRSFNQYISIY